MISINLDGWDTEDAVNRCHKLARVLASGTISFDEYVTTLAYTTAEVRKEDMPKCIETVPVELFEHFREAVTLFLRSCDFMPSQVAGCLVGAPFSAEDLLEAKRLFRPKYVRLLELVESRAALLAQNGSP
jgi:hypothetical protein